jgi:hypothetical protein
MPSGTFRFKSLAGILYTRQTGSQCATAAEVVFSRFGNNDEMSTTTSPTPNRKNVALKAMTKGLLPGDAFKTPPRP